jgi:hypothetical protein
MGTDIHLWVEYKDDKGNWVEPDREETECYECNGGEDDYDDEE